MKTVQVLIFGTILGTLSNSTFARTVQREENLNKVETMRLPHSMGVLGDSISAGFLSTHSRGLNSTWELSKLVLQLLNHEWIFGVGKVLETPKTSWASGTRKFDSVKSHLERIEALSGRPLKVQNSARSGADSFSVLYDQVPRLKEWSRRKLHQEAPDYITLLIGPNDICANTVDGMTSVADYSRNIAQIIEQLLSDSPTTKLMISSLPNVEELRNVALESPVFRNKNFSCEKFWIKMKTCPTLTGVRGADRVLIRERVEDYNETLRQLSEEYSQVYGDRVRYAEGVYNVHFSADDLSLDCFHPNRRGHEIISQKAWEQSWWANGRKN